MIMKKYDFELAQEWKIQVSAFRRTNKQPTFEKRGYRYLRHTVEKISANNRLCTVWLFEYEELPERRIAVEKAKELIEQERADIEAAEVANQEIVPPRRKTLRDMRSEQDAFIKSLVMNLIKDSDKEYVREYKTKSEYMILDAKRKQRDSQEFPHKPIQAISDRGETRITEEQSILFRKSRTKKGIDPNKLPWGQWLDLNHLQALGLLDIVFYYEHDTWTGGRIKKYRIKHK